MKKRIFALLLAGAMIFGLAACSNGETETSTYPGTQTSTAPNGGDETTGGIAKEDLVVGFVHVGVCFIRQEMAGDAHGRIYKESRLGKAVCD